MDGKANPALNAIAFLAGEWAVELSNAPFLSDPKATVRISASFEWIGDGAALMMSQRDKPSSPPAATWIIGRDEAVEDYRVLYNDSRGVSRIYEMSFASRVWRMWRHNPKFSQRFTGRLSQDLTRVDASWEKSMDGERTWEHDFDMTFLRP